MLRLLRRSDEGVDRIVDIDGISGLLAANQGDRRVSPFSRFPDVSDDVRSLARSVDQGWPDRDCGQAMEGGVELAEPPTVVLGEGVGTQGRGMSARIVWHHRVPVNFARIAE